MVYKGLLGSVDYSSRFSEIRGRKSGEEWLCKIRVSNRDEKGLVNI